MIAASDGFAPATLVACAIGLVALPVWWRIVRLREAVASPPPARAVDALWPVPGGFLLFLVYALLIGGAMLGIQRSQLGVTRVALGAAVLVGIAVSMIGLPRLLRPKVRAGRAIGFGVLTFLAALPVVYGIAFVESLLFVEMPQQSMVELIGRRGDGVRELVFLTVAVAPLMEELIFRGLFYGGLSRTRGPRYALVFSACVFGVVHYDPWVAILPMTALGFFLGMLMQRTGSLVACFTAHALFNLLSVGVLVFS